MEAHAGPFRGLRTQFEKNCHVKQDIKQYMTILTIRTDLVCEKGPI